MTTTIDPTRSADIDTPAEIRARFPALARRHAGHPVAYFDGPGGTQVPQAVVDAMAEYLLHHNANPHWRYPTSEETDRLLAGARARRSEGNTGTAAAQSLGGGGCQPRQSGRPNRRGVASSSGPTLSKVCLMLCRNSLWRQILRYSI